LMVIAVVVPVAAGDFVCGTVRRAAGALGSYLAGVHGAVSSAAVMGSGVGRWAPTVVRTAAASPGWRRLAGGGPTAGWPGCWRAAGGVHR
jgi:hypothetical protein